MRLRLTVLLCLAFLADPARAADDGSGYQRGWMKEAQTWFSGLWGHDAKSWLRRIGPALREQNYQGTLVFVAGDRIETMSVFHAFQNGRERERLATLTGPHREVIRDDKLVLCIGTGVLPVGYDADTGGRWNPAQQFTNADSFTGYRARLAGNERVADRDTQVVDLAATDEWRYGYRLWLEKTTGLPLRIAVLGRGGEPLEQIAFTELRLGAMPAESDLRPSTDKGLQRIQSLGPGKESDPGWRVGDLPQGFELRAARRLGGAVQLLYSDGLANVSVYIEPMLANQAGESAMHRGAVNARSVWQGGRRVVAIGKVPSETVDRFARNVRVPEGG